MSAGDGKGSKGGERGEGAGLGSKELAFALLPLAPVVADTITDAILVVDYWRKDHPYWSLGTLSLIIVPAVVIQLFSMRWHLADETATVRHWISHSLLLGVLHRYATIVKTGIEAIRSKSQGDVQRMRLQQSDICMLHLFESFLEAAPQLLLQLYIMVMFREWHAFTGISAIASLCSLSWAIVNYLRALRRVRTDKACVRNPALILQVTWRGALLLARISALLLFAIGFHHWLFVLLGIHWFSMTIWVIHQKTDFCPSRPEEIFYNCVVGVIYCFCFFNLKEGQARYRMFAFYIIMITQNITCLLLYFFLSEPDPIKNELTIISTSLIIGGTTVGLGSMFVFYRWFHPGGPIKWCKTKKETRIENTVQVVVTHPSKPSNDPANYTLRSLKKPWIDAIESPIKDEGICLENSPQSEAECTDKKLLLDHWIARAGSPTFASAPIDKNESVDITGVEFYSVNNTPDKFSTSRTENGVINTSFQIENEPIDRKKIDSLNDEGNKSQMKNKRRGICPPDVGMKYSTLERKNLSDVEIANQKRRGICSSSQLEEVASKDNSLDDMVENLKSVSEISSKSSTDRSNKKTSCESINLDLDLSFSDINSSDINEFNENIVQKLCLSTLKNIKNVHQDADIQNIQRIALEILKDLYSKGGLKDDQDIESELSSSVGRDLDTPSEALSTHDYENICAVNIAREAWGLRSWRACADMGASPPPPPLPARRIAPLPHNINRDQYINTVAYELSRCGDTDCQHNEKLEYSKEPDSVFIAKPYVIDQNGGMFPLTSPLEPILEEIDEIIDNNTMRKRKRHSSESALVATIDEIRHDNSTHSPRNVYHRADWDSPIPNVGTNDTPKNWLNHSAHAGLRKSLWKANPTVEDKSSRNNIKDESKNSLYKNVIGSSIYKYDRSTLDNVTTARINKTYNNTIENKIKNVPSANYKQLKNNELIKSEKNNIRKNDQIIKSQYPKKDVSTLSSKIDVIAEEVTGLPTSQEHNLSYEEVVFLSQFVSGSESFLFKKNTNMSSDDISNLGVSSSLQSLIDKDNHGSLASTKPIDTRISQKRGANKPRRKFSLLREKFELKSKHSDEEMLFQSLESIKSASQNNLDIASSQNLLNSNSNVIVVNQEPNINFDKENLTPSVKFETKVSPVKEVNESVVLSLTPCDNPPSNSSVTNLKEKRSIFLKQVLSPPKINSWNKKL